ncbi:MAG: LTA synthase family protein, partial [Flavobacteriales bacterium]|nr:LTA synthase family protein [Flavobacteriales bacterium]
MNVLFWKRFIGVWLIAFLSLTLSRLVFYFNLLSYFESPFAELANALWFGLQFDAVSIAFLLGIFFIALPFIKKGWSQNLASGFYIVMLGAMNLLNCIDAEFFKFTARRSTDDLFEYAFLSDDLFNIGPNLLSHFWYLLVVFIVIMLLSLWLFLKLMKADDSKVKLWAKALALIPTALILVLAARGGLRPIPLTIIDAGMTNAPHLNAVVLSTPFTIIKTWGKPELSRYEFPADETVVLNPIIKPDSTAFTGKLKGKNVVIIIMESFATEYIHALNGLDVGYTPFVDSLCSVGLVFENGYANGHRSIEGIPAIVASIPTLMYEPYTTSRYAGNNVSSLANLLGKKGYYTTFMHGGNKNSMNFTSFAGQAGYDLFYDRDDYPFPDEHYDGFWGISDHYFLNHCVEKFSEYQKPFFSTIFTLSSHHPYSLPKEYQDKYPKGTLPIHESLGYADEALLQFFENASKTDWYQNTLFVITADHTSLSEHPQFQTKLGSLRIPIIFYAPSDSTISGRFRQIVQQADIMPTILDLLGYDQPYFSLGVNAFDSTSNHFAVAFKHDQQQLYRNGQLICFDGEHTTFGFDVEKDELNQNNLVNSDISYSDNEK